MRNSGRFSRIYRSKLRDFCTANYFVLSCSWFLLFCFFSIFSVELSCPYLNSTTFSLSSFHKVQGTFDCRFFFWNA